MALPIKKDIAVTKRVLSQVPAGIYDALMLEIDARNKRLGDDADADFYVAPGLELVTEELRKERLEHEKKAKEPKGKPDLKPVEHHQQSA